jgi:hypothetical protein
MRFSVVLGVALALAGCSSSDTKPEPAPAAASSGHRLTLSEDELEQAGDALSAKLAALPQQDPAPRIRVERFKNLTSHHLDTSKLEDEARRRLVESNRYSVASDPSKTTDFLLLGEAHDDRIRFDIVDSLHKAVVQSVTIEFTGDRGAEPHETR